MKKILIVEDELFIANFIKNTLQSNGICESIIANNYELAVKEIENQFFDLVLIDINLNQLKTGIDFAKKITLNLETPFVYITSYSDRITLSDAAETMPSGYLVKPFKPEDLIAMVTIALKNSDNNKIVYNKVDHSPNEYQASFRIKKVIKFLNKNLDKTIDINDLAELTHWKKHHLIRVFKHYLGKTPYQYFLELKIEKSKIILLETDISLNQVSFELGFKSYSNFWNAFIKINGITPNDFRKLNKKN